MSEKPDIIERLGDYCDGHPHARIPWPHRVLHDAIAELRAVRADLAASQAEVGLLLGFLHRAFVQLNEMAGEGLSFTGQEDPADILFDYARSVGTPDDDMEAILVALAARALTPKP